MCDFVDMTTSVFIQHLARLIDEKTGTLIGSNALSHSTHPIQSKESRHRFIGRVMRFIRFAFDQSVSDNILIQLQETPESLFRLMLYFVRSEVFPQKFFDRGLPVSKELLSEIESVFHFFLLLASESDSDLVFEVFEKRGDYAPL